MTRAERRHRRERVINRRVTLLNAISGTAGYRHFGVLAKTKPWDCSCWMCSHGADSEPPYRGKERQTLKAILQSGDTIESLGGFAFNPSNLHSQTPEVPELL